MGSYLGIDTSNYTTSAALYQTEGGRMISRKQLLPVQNGSIGLRQSEAVFQHVKQLPEIMDAVFQEESSLSAVGVSVRPRDLEDSYMPCFLVGQLAGRAVSASHKIPLHTFSHQAGHIAAALYSAGCQEFRHRELIAFHLSGGTTECLLVKPCKKHIFQISLVGKSLDLKAGQLVDRVGALLGTGFPAGKELEAMAEKSEAVYPIHPTIKGLDCCLSGVENQVKDLLRQGVPKEDIACYCLAYIEAVVERMTERALQQYGDLPLIYAGGVMSNRKIRETITRKFGGYFAEPEFSSDNAGGIALLSCWKEEER